MREDIRNLIETICEISQYTECDLVFIEKIANQYGFTINESLCLEEVS